MVKRFLMILALAALAAGCEYDFELKGFDDPDKLFVEFVSNGSDTTSLHIHTCLPTARSGEKKTVNTVLKALSVTADGKKLKVSKVEGQPNLWSVVGAIPPGSLLKVSAEAEGSDPVEGQCRIPQMPKIGKILVKETPNADDGMFEADIDLAGETLLPGERWAVSCIYKMHDWTTGIPESEGGEIDENIELNPYIERYVSDESVFSELETAFLDNYDYGSRLHIICDDNGSDGHIRFFFPQFPPYREEIHNEEWEDWYGNVHPAFDYVHERTSSFSIGVYKVAEEMYSYIKAQDAAENNALALAGLAPAMFAYSNVKGGFGLVAGYSGGLLFHQELDLP